MRRIAPHKLPIVVLISGRGTNLQAIIDAASGDDLPVEIRAVLSNEPDAAGLDRARHVGIPVRVVEHRQFARRPDFDRALAGVIDNFHPELVVLAGFMRILTPAFVDHFHGRLINIHPSLLPAFPGLNTHQRAIDAGAREHGVSVHYVTGDLDGGPIIIQARLPVGPRDDAESLAARVLEQEHRVLPQVIRWFAQQRLRLDAGRVLLDGEPLPATGASGL